MKLDNESTFDAKVQVADLMKDELRGAVIVKSTFDIHPDGRLTVSEEPMPLVLDRLETPFGEFHGELFFRKQGADVCLLGSVRRKTPVTQARLRVVVGDRVDELVVWGDRFWLPRVHGPGLEPSDPHPFTELPLSYHYAYGGRSEYNGMEVALADNPVGRGYYVEQDQAEKNRLPNIEPAEGPPVRQWSDKGSIAGWGPYPMYWGLRAQSSVDIDEDRAMVSKIHPRLFNHAHPRLCVPELRPGQPIQVYGMREHPFELRVPELPVQVDLQLGQSTTPLDAPIDGVFAWVDAKKLVVTQRARFGYQMRAKELRKVTVRPAHSYS
ncbi:MAG: DUF2169 domain-containing protein [Myxococcales bacterium]|nr:DUF2169 domain-containing protein [Myxococcales bacterium]